MKQEKCSALIGNDCKNGFSVSAVCHGIGTDSVAPMCCKEELCGRLFNNNGGKPNSMQEAAHGIKE
jgi:hypothetical protein